MNISEYTAKIDKLFLTAQLYPELGIKTIGIGDGEWLQKCAGKVTLSL